MAFRGWGVLPSKAREIISAPTLAVEGELAVIGESSPFEQGQPLRDRLATRDRKSLPEHLDVLQSLGIQPECL